VHHAISNLLQLIGDFFHTFFRLLALAQLDHSTGILAPRMSEEAINDASSR
jgi:hypothetical protein